MYAQSFCKRIKRSDNDKAASKTFNMNVGLQAVTGSAPGAFTKLVGRTKIFNAVAKTKWSKGLIGISVDSFLEGFEEVSQDQIKNYNLTGEYDFLAKSNLETFTLGAIGGLFGKVTVWFVKLEYLFKLQLYPRKLMVCVACGRTVEL